VRRYSLISLDLLPHFSWGCSTILLVEGLPSQTDWQDGKVSKEGAPHNNIVWTVKLEQKGLSSLQRAKIRGRVRLPEIHFIRAKCLKKAVPTIVGHPNIEFHGLKLSSR
jgi:hypothetical protein